MKSEKNKGAQSAATSSVMKKGKEETGGGTCGGVTTLPEIQLAGPTYFAEGLNCLPGSSVGYIKLGLPTSLTMRTSAWPLKPGGLTPFWLHREFTHRKRYSSALSWNIPTPPMNIPRIRSPDAREIRSVGPVLRLLKRFSGAPLAILPACPWATQSSFLLAGNSPARGFTLGDPNSGDDIAINA